MSDLLAEFPQLLSGLYVTLIVFAGAAVLALGCALVAGVARTSSNRFARYVSVVYVELFRGTSAVIQLFWIFFALPFLGIRLEPLQAGIVGLGLCAGAYGAEVVRSALASVARSQHEAAASLGLSRWQSFFLIILPQSLPAMIPPGTNIMIELVKLTPLVSLITLQDITFQARVIQSRTLGTTSVFLFLIVIYYILNVIVMKIGSRLEKITQKYRGKFNYEPR